MPDRFIGGKKVALLLAVPLIAGSAVLYYLGTEGPQTSPPLGAKEPPPQLAVAAGDVELPAAPAQDAESVGASAPKEADSHGQPALELQLIGDDEGPPDEAVVRISWLDREVFLSAEGQATTLHHRRTVDAEKTETGTYLARARHGEVAKIEIEASGFLPTSELVEVPPGVREVGLLVPKIK